MEDRFDKIKGSLMLGFIGDALGAAYEFPRTTTLDDKDAINKGLLTSYQRITMSSRFRGTGPAEFEAGTITDDSILTIELLSSLAAKENKATRLRRYYDTIKSGGEFGSATCGMFGKNTLALFKNLRYEENYKNNFGVEVGEYMTIPPLALSNGNLMRAGPLAYRINNPKIDKEIENEVMITNPTEICVVTTLIYIYCCRCGLAGREPNRAYKRAKEKAADFPDIAKVFECIDDNKNYLPSLDEKKKGYVLVAFYWSMMGLKKYIEGKPFSKILAWVVSQGGDTDTNAAITGTLLGSFIGLKEILKDKIAKKNIQMITAYQEKEKYRRVPIDVWETICERAETLMNM